MREMKDSDIEWIGEIPKEWDTNRTKMLFKIVNGATPKSGNAEFWDGDIDWITPADYCTSDMFIECGKRTITAIGLDSCGTSLVDEGSIIISNRAPIGNVAIAKKRLCTNQGCKSLVNISFSNEKYYYYFFSIMGYSLNMLGRGTTFMELSSSDLGSYVLPVPTPKEQQTIADYLDRNCCEIDSVIAAKEKTNSLLKEQRQSIIYEAVTKGLDATAIMRDSGIEWIGKVPKEWRTVRLKHIVATKITDGPHTTPQLLEEGIPFVSAESIKGNKVNLDLKRGYISQEDHEIFCQKCKPQKNDIFMVKSGATTGAIGLVESYDEFSIWSPLALIRCRDSEFDQKYVFYSMLSDSFRKQVELFWNYGTQQNIGMNLIENLSIVMPGKVEQKMIADYLDKKCTEVDQLIQVNNKIIEKLKEYRISIIYEAVTGKTEIY